MLNQLQLVITGHFKNLKSEPTVKGAFEEQPRTFVTHFVIELPGNSRPKEEIKKD